MARRKTRRDFACAVLLRALRSLKMVALGKQASRLLHEILLGLCGLGDGMRQTPDLSWGMRGFQLVW